MKKVIAWCVVLVRCSRQAARHGQDFRGRINGTLTITPRVLPGVTVTAPAGVIQAQVQVTGTDGGFRFQALPPGVYELSFELAGFQNVKREGIRVVIGQTLTVDQKLEVASLQETVTVSGSSPIVDTTTTTMGTNFTKELLTEIPNARDVWASMSQAPGIQMQGFDVGGSHAGTSTSYVTYGLDVQNQTRIEGVDTTEGVQAATPAISTSARSKSFRSAAPAATPRGFAPGASLSISVKSGGDRFSGNWYSDWQGDSTITDNVAGQPAHRQHAG